MTSVTKGLVFAYIFEGISIGLLVASVGSIGSLIGETVDEEDKTSTRIIQWVFTLLAALVSHVVAESLRHDRILGLLKNVSSKLSFKRHSSGNNTQPSTPVSNGLFPKRSVPQETITSVTKF